jgi:hypothetical protein
MRLPQGNARLESTTTRLPHIERIMRKGEAAVGKQSVKGAPRALPIAEEHINP